MARRKRIALLCGGGDCPGLNAVIRAVVKSAILDYGFEVFGSEDSFEGFLKPGRMIPLTVDSVRGILPRGGTILGTTNRGNPFKYPVKAPDGRLVEQDLSGEVIQKFREMQFSALIAIGGDGTLSIAQKFFDRGIPVVGVPKTIDNDLLATEVTFGFDTAVNTATEAIDRIHTTAESHDRVMVVELMGRNSGWIALHAGTAGGADVILIPEIPFHIDRVCKKIQARIDQGRTFSIVVVAEGAIESRGAQIYQDEGRLGGIGLKVAEMIQAQMETDTRVLVLGHLQRGGSPTAFDRLLGTRMGVAATRLVALEQFGRMVCLRCARIDSVPIAEAVEQQRKVDPRGEEVQSARAIGISFGD